MILGNKIGGNARSRSEGAQLGIGVLELARRLDIGRNAAYSLVNSEGFPRLTIGKRIIIPLEPLDRWIAAQTNVATDRDAGLGA